MAAHHQSQSVTTLVSLVWRIPLGLYRRWCYFETRVIIRLVMGNHSDIVKQCSSDAAGRVVLDGNYCSNTAEFDQGELELNKLVWRTNDIAAACQNSLRQSHDHLSMWGLRSTHVHAIVFGLLP